MVSALLLAALAPGQYQPVLIHSLKFKYFPGTIRCTVLTESETLAGFVCNSVGHHGELTLAKPFVWSNGKFFELPLLPKAEYGHVLAGNDEMLVGDALIDYRHVPVVWKRDPQLGWARAKVTKLAEKAGEASHIGPDGTIWVSNENKIVGRVLAGKWTSVDLGPFELVGIDAKGRLYGNEFKGIMFGGEPARTTPGVFDGNQWRGFEVKDIDPSFYSDTMLRAVNKAGLAVGCCENQAAIWVNGKATPFLSGIKRWSYAHDVNDKGAVVGSCAVPAIDKAMAFLWENGELTDLSKKVQGVLLETAQKINNRGSIVALGEKKKEVELYLLRPKR